MTTGAPNVLGDPADIADAVAFFSSRTPQPTGADRRRATLIL